jgi:hypothetical protein
MQPLGPRSVWGKSDPQGRRDAPLLPDKPRAEDRPIGPLYRGRSLETASATGRARLALGDRQCAQQPGHQRGPQARYDDAEHVSGSSKHQRQRQVDQFNADKWRDQPADAIDHQIAVNVVSALVGMNRTPRSAKGISNGITSALKLKINADNTALLRRRQFHNVQARQSR